MAKEEIGSTQLRIQGGELAQNTLLNLIGNGLPLIVGVVAIPYVIRGMGTERFGLLSLVWIVLGYFAVFDLGLGVATTRFVAEAMGRGERERVRTLVWSATSLQAVFGIAGAFLLVALTPYLTGHVLNIPPGMIGEAKESFYLLAGSLPVVFVAGSLRGVLEANQRFGLVNAVKLPLSMASFVFPYVGVLLGWGLPGIVALLVASRCIGLVIYYRLNVKVFPPLKVLSRPDLDELKRLVGFGGWVTVSTVISPLLIHLERFMIGALVTLSMVAYYSAPFEMVIRLLIIPMSLVSTLFAAFTTLVSQDQWEQIRFLLARSLKWSLLCIGPLVVVIVALGHELLELWLGPVFAEKSTVTLQVLSVGILINALAHIPHSLIQALGRPDLTGKFHLAELPLHILLVYLLVSVWGITGAAVACLIRAMVDAFLLFFAVCRLSSLSPRFFLSDKVVQTIVILVLFAGAAIGMRELLFIRWIRFLSLGVAFLLVGWIFWHYLLDRRDQTQILRLIRSAGIR